MRLLKVCRAHDGRIEASGKNQEYDGAVVSSDFENHDQSKRAIAVGLLVRSPPYLTRQIRQLEEGLAKFTHKHFVTASLRSRLGKATESTTLTEPQPLGRGNGTKAAG
jgi:hypothetical protein